MKKYFTFVSYFILPTTLFACVSQQRNAEEIEVKLIPANGISAEGNVIFKTLSDNKIQISGEIINLTPGKHGMHIHAVANCTDTSNGFKTAQSHFNPNHSHHGALENGHTGDLGNIIANEHGVATFDIITAKFNLKKDDPHSILEKALLVHASEDDEKTDPAGNSGERILCGVIK